MDWNIITYTYNSNTHLFTVNHNACGSKVDITPTVRDSHCSNIHQFPLSDNVYVSMCDLQGSLVYDIRQFVSGNATIKGISLNKNQWLNLKTYATKYS